MKKAKFYRVYRVLTDENGNVIHKCPSCSCGKLSVALMRARVWGGVVYAIYDDGSEEPVRA